MRFPLFFFALLSVLLAGAPAQAVDGLFIRGGAALAVVDTIDGVVFAPNDAATLDQDINAGFAFDLAVGYRRGGYALSLQGGYMRNGLGQSTATFQSDGATNIVDQSGTFQRFNLGVVLDRDLARQPIGAMGVVLRPFLSAGLGLQWARFRYDPRTNSAGDFFDGRFERALEVIGSTGLGLGVGFRNGWEMDVRYTAALISDARFEGEGTQTGSTLGFAQFQQSIGVGLTIPIAALFGDRAAGRPPRNPEIDPLRR